MPIEVDEQINLYIEKLEEIAIPITLSVKANEEKALQLCEEYLKNGNKNIKNLNPLSVYYIISKLDENRQIDFIKENIEYIKENEENIFLYNMIVPESLSYFLSYKVIKELKNIDVDIFKKIISRNQKNLFRNFTQEDYYSFYIEFYKELNEIKNRDFIDALYFHNRFCYNNININNVLVNNIDNLFVLQRKYNEEFMNFLLEKYNEKIKTFSSKELLSFIEYIVNINVYKDFVSNHYNELNKAFQNITEYDLMEYLGESDNIKQEILISNFFENILIKRDIKKIIYNLEPNIIIDLYKKNKELFKSLSLNDWVNRCSKLSVLTDDFKSILDIYEINNIEELFDTDYYFSKWYSPSILSLKYIELKYRNNIKIKGQLEEIDENTSIFSSKYLENLSELRELLRNNLISKNSSSYKKHLYNFILFLKNNNIIENTDNFEEIEMLFYKIVKGESITILYKISNIEEITLFNRLGEIDFYVLGFMPFQLKRYNVKQHKQLCMKYDKCDSHGKSYKQLILKLMFLVGFTNAKFILELDDQLPVLEHLVGNVDVKNVVLDDKGNPILNTKLMNLLFSNKNSKIKDMLSNKDSDLYKYFPRIFNEWEMIKLNGKDKSLKIAIEFLKSDSITLNPKYYRLNGLFKFIGCENNIVNETLCLHDQMLTRVNSTIPRIIGKSNEYSYEVLRLDDMEALAIGNKTDCCFTVLGNGYSSLKHALTSDNGRIFVIRKGNHILAHSWLWRNGDLLCFDNIEISKKINSVDFFDVHLQAINELMKISYENEGIDNCIKNVTIGFTNFDKEIRGIEKYPCLILKTYNLEDQNFESKLGKNRIFVDTLPKPLENVEYRDSKNVQYLIKGNGIFNLGQSLHAYRDERKEIMHYLEDREYDDDYIELILNKVNALRYIKAERENNLSNFFVLDIEDLIEIHCNDDWYLITYNDGIKEEFNSNFDKRSELEMKSISKSEIKLLKKITIK